MADGIRQWLEDLGLGKFVELFAENDIDLVALPHITEEDLKELGVTLGARRKILAATGPSGTALQSTPVVTFEPETPLTAMADAASPADVVGERRQVTVLFADLTGFTRLTSEMDAEDTHALLNRYFGAVDTVVKSYGGMIDKHIGDAVMAVFGAPIAHDDDPERAVRSALDIHVAVANLDPPLSAHVGIASGQVIASGTGSDAHREYTVTGESVNLASRLTDLAGEDMTLVSEAVRLALEDRLNVEALGESQIQGLMQPVKVWRLEGLRSQEETARRHFVGRKTEIRQFAGVIESCLESRTGQTIYVRGEAGIGKTRLLAEFQSLAADNGFANHKALVLDFGVGEGQDAIRALVRSLLDVPPGCDTKKRADIANLAYKDGYLDSERQVYLNDLLDLPQPTELQTLYEAMDNEARNRGKKDTVVEFVRIASAKRPLLLAVEDIHWANKVTLEHLASITRTVNDCAALLVMTSRVDGDPIDLAWRGEAGNSPLATFDLGPLRDSEALELAQGYVDTSSQFAKECIARAEGNPLFLEQLLSSAEEIGEEEVPGSVQSIILARMDQLDQGDKIALQAASVIGQRFSLDALRHVIDDGNYRCGNLITHFLVRPEGEDFLFTNALVRDGVYISLLNTRRRELHRRAADWFVDRDTILHAEHLDRADDPATAEAYLKAALLQLAQYRYESTLASTERGLEVAKEGPTKYELGCLRGDMLRELGDSNRSIDNFEITLEAANDGAQRCRAWLGMAAGMRVVDRYDDALTILNRAEDVATEHGLDSDLAQIHNLRGNIFFPLGNFDGCLEQHARANEFAHRSGSPEYEAQALGGLGDAYFVGGKMITAHNHFRQCIEVSRQHNLRRIEIANLHMQGETRLYMNELQAALDDCLAAVEPAARIGHYRAELATRIVMSYLLHDMGRMSEAEQQSEQCVIMAHRLGASRFEAQAHIFLGQVLASTGRHIEGIKRVEDAVSLGRKSGITYSGPWALGALAVIARDPAKRKAALEEGEEILRQECIGHNYFWFYRNAMESSLESGEWDEVEQYATALETYTRLEPLPWSDFFIARGRALAAFGRGQRDAETIDRLRQLRDQAQGAGFGVPLPALEATLTSS